MQSVANMRHLEPCTPILEPPRPIEEEFMLSDENATDTLRGVLESLLSVNYLRGHADACNDSGGSNKDPTSPAAIMAAMDSRLTVSVPYLLTLAPVRAAMPWGIDERGAVDMILSAARMSQKIVLNSRPKEVRVGPYPQASLRSRCTLQIHDVESVLTLADVQRETTRYPIFQFYRVSPDIVNVTFEDARSAKEAFVQLQGKPLGGCAAVVVKMRVEYDKQMQPQRRPLPSASALRTAPRAAASCIPPVAPVDTCVQTMPAEKPVFVRSPWAKFPGNNNNMARQPCGGMPRWENEMSRRHGSAMSEALAVQLSRDMQMLAMQEYLMSTAMASNGSHGSWERNELPRQDSSPFTSVNYGNLPPAFTPRPPCPVGGDSRCMGGSIGFRSMRSPGMEWPACPQGAARLPPAPAGSELPWSSERVETTCPGRRLQHDPYRGGLYVACPKPSPNAATFVPPEPPKSLLRFRPHGIKVWATTKSNSINDDDDDDNNNNSSNLRVCSPLMPQLTESLKLTVSSTDENSPPYMTPSGESSHTPSDVDAGGSRPMTYADVIRASRVLDSPTQSRAKEAS
ncbi:hypothetical protein DQ04_03501000 [Trypanosoma grayi]|uniref:hypothetical protein n=1 Tax=Trypanosoma grayi TaxID=71804 RepID=UPI0004F3F0DC|nr:hypothetical protein DQ04_03501000 [Trypanosoma grayi]KEG10616.1 hypothetical protein DQ04_03501000 [Trypanosoma grayi]